MIDGAQIKPQMYYPSDMSAYQTETQCDTLNSHKYTFLPITSETYLPVNF